MARCWSWKLSGCHVIPFPQQEVDRCHIWEVIGDVVCRNHFPSIVILAFTFPNQVGEKILGSGEHLGSILVKGICFSFPLTASKLSSIPRKMINDSTRKPKAYELLYLTFFSSSFSYLWTVRLFLCILAWGTQNSRNLHSPVSRRACGFYWLIFFLMHLSNYLL